MTQLPIKTLVFSGGGIKGFAFLGALKLLFEQNILDLNLIDTFIGTSIGSIISFFLCINCSIKEIIKFILKFNFNKLEPEINYIDLFEKNGINNGKRLMLIFKHFLELKLKKNDITFQELYELTNKKLIIIGTNYTLGREERFSIDNNPHMSVLTAIRISISVPIIFIPVLYNDNWYVDGALSNNFPIQGLDRETTMGFYIRNVTKNEITNITTFIMGCLSIVTDTISEKDINDFKYIIKIENCKQEFTNFNLSNEKKKILINLGIKPVQEFLSKPEIICRKILNDIILNSTISMTQI